MAGQVKADCAANLMKRSYLYTASFARPVRAVRAPPNANDPVQSWATVTGIPIVIGRLLSTRTAITMEIETDRSS